VSRQIHVRSPFVCAEVTPGGAAADRWGLRQCFPEGLLL
jgi:hypothetical protein